jgi:hypothetical protein
MKASKIRGLAFATTCVASLLVTVAANATLASFDFEGLPATGGGADTSLVQSNNGLTMTITRPGSNFDIANLSGITGPNNWGSSTLSPFNDTSNTPFVINFSSTITDFTVQMGDYDQDSDTLTLDAYSGADGTGTLIAQDVIDWGDGNIVTDLAAFLEVSGAGINSITMIGGGSDFPNSVYYDNITAQYGSSAVPEPLTLTLFGAGLAGLGAFRRRRKVAKA